MEPGKEELTAGDATRVSRVSRVGQVETPLDALDADVHPVKPVRHGGVLVLKIADALLDLAAIVAHVIERATDVSQVKSRSGNALPP